ncbi:chitin synthase, partial [Mytilus galloprovincialis]
MQDLPDIKTKTTIVQDNGGKNKRDMFSYGSGTIPTHVFIEDAFDPLDGEETYPNVNIHVETFIKCIYMAGSCIYGRDIKLDDGYMYRTPYGARINWILPGGNKLIAHLKDKTKIRFNRRWTQVMYMNYIFKWCIHENHGELGKKAALENTYILTLDADVQFKPEDVRNLIRRMNKSKLIGAACGRIHPLGRDEIRWLCTMLVKQGWKIEYCDDSHAYTYVPEEFKSLYNQRRRWIPSTLANILDVLRNWQKMFMFVSTLLKPGTIFMTIFGAIIVGFDGISPWLSLILNLIPVGLFVLMTLYSPAEKQ